MIPARGKILVTPIETEQTMPGGSIILIDDTRQKLASHQMTVLAVGAPAFCDDPEHCDVLVHGKELLDGTWYDYHPNDPLITDGAWVFVQPRSLVPASDREPHYLITADDILGVFTE